MSRHFLDMVYNRDIKPYYTSNMTNSIKYPYIRYITGLYLCIILIALFHATQGQEYDGRPYIKTSQFTTSSNAVLQYTDPMFGIDLDQTSTQPQLIYQIYVSDVSQIVSYPYTFKFWLLCAPVVQKTGNTSCNPEPLTDTNPDYYLPIYSQDMVITSSTDRNKGFSLSGDVLPGGLQCVSYLGNKIPQRETYGFRLSDYDVYSVSRAFVTRRNKIAPVYSWYGTYDTTTQRPVYQLTSLSRHCPFSTGGNQPFEILRLNIMMSSACTNTITTLRNTISSTPSDSINILDQNINFYTGVKLNHNFNPDYIGLPASYERDSTTNIPINVPYTSQILSSSPTANTLISQRVYTWKDWTTTLTASINNDPDIWTISQQPATLTSELSDYISSFGMILQSPRISYRQSSADLLYTSSVSASIYNTAYTIRRTPQPFYCVPLVQHKSVPPYSQSPVTGQPQSISRSSPLTLNNGLVGYPSTFLNLQYEMYNIPNIRSLAYIKINYIPSKLDDTLEEGVSLQYMSIPAYIADISSLITTPFTEYDLLPSHWPGLIKNLRIFVGMPAVVTSANFLSEVEVSASTASTGLTIGARDCISFPVNSGTFRLFESYSDDNTKQIPDIFTSKLGKLIDDSDSANNPIIWLDNNRIVELTFVGIEFWSPFVVDSEEIVYVTLTFNTDIPLSIPFTYNELFSSSFPSPFETYKIYSLDVKIRLSLNVIPISSPDIIYIKSLTIDLPSDFKQKLTASTSSKLGQNLIPRTRLHYTFPPLSADPSDSNTSIFSIQTYCSVDVPCTNTRSICSTETHQCVCPETDPDCFIPPTSCPQPCYPNTYGEDTAGMDPFDYNLCDTSSQCPSCPVGQTGMYCQFGLFSFTLDAAIPSDTEQSAITLVETSINTLSAHFSFLHPDITLEPSSERQPRPITFTPISTVTTCNQDSNKLVYYITRKYTISYPISRNTSQTIQSILQFKSSFNTYVNTLFQNDISQLLVNYDPVLPQCQKHGSLLIYINPISNTELPSDTRHLCPAPMSGDTCQINLQDKCIKSNTVPWPNVPSTDSLWRDPTICECIAGYTGPTCQQSSTICTDEAETLQWCSLRGIVTTINENSTTCRNTCSCNTGYTGDMCQTVLPCPIQCFPDDNGQPVDSIDPTVYERCGTTLQCPKCPAGREGTYCQWEGLTTHITIKTTDSIQNARNKAQSIIDTIKTLYYKDDITHPDISTTLATSTRSQLVYNVNQSVSSTCTPTDQTLSKVNIVSIPITFYLPILRTSIQSTRDLIWQLRQKWDYYLLSDEFSQLVTTTITTAYIPPVSSCYGSPNGSSPTDSTPLPVEIPSPSPVDDTKLCTGSSSTTTTCTLPPQALCDMSHTIPWQTGDNVSICKCQNGWTGPTCNQSTECTTKASTLRCSAYGYVTVTKNDDTNRCSDSCTCLYEWYGPTCSTCQLKCYNRGEIRNITPSCYDDLSRTLSPCVCADGTTGRYCQYRQITSRFTVNNVVLPDWLLYGIPSTSNGLLTVDTTSDEQAQSNEFFIALSGEINQLLGYNNDGRLYVTNMDSNIPRLYQLDPYPRSDMPSSYRATTRSICNDNDSILGYTTVYTTLSFIMRLHTGSTVGGGFKQEATALQTEWNKILLSGKLVTAINTVLEKFNVERLFKVYPNCNTNTLPDVDTVVVDDGFIPGEENQTDGGDEDSSNSTYNIMYYNIYMYITIIISLLLALSSIA